MCMKCFKFQPPQHNNPCDRCVKEPHSLAINGRVQWRLYVNYMQRWTTCMFHLYSNAVYSTILPRPWSERAERSMHIITDANLFGFITFTGGTIDAKSAAKKNKQMKNRNYHLADPKLPYKYAYSTTCSMHHLTKWRVEKRAISVAVNVLEKL